MKTTFRSSRRKGPKPKSAAILLCAVLIAVLGYAFRAPLSSALHTVMSPIYKGGGSLGAAVVSSFEHFNSKEYLIGENRKLTVALEEARLVALDRNLLYEENLSLKERFSRLGDPNAILAAVILKPPFTPYDTLLIDIGSRDGVSVGDKVAAVGTVLIGVVAEAFSDSARVVLYSTPGESHEAYLEGVAAPVTLEGQGGGGMKARVPYGIIVATGTAISIPSISANTAGIVEHVTFKEGDAYSEVYVRLPVNPFSLTHVDVWRAKKQ